jgi:putative ABC transport system substrate-binding protein
MTENGDYVIYALGPVRRARAVALAFAFSGAILLAPVSSGAQPEKVYRIGYLQTSTRAQQVHLVRAFEDGLRDLGYVVGRNLMIEYRFADGKLERLPQLAEDLVRLKVDVIVTGTNPNAIAAKRATTTIPIVMTTSVDPVGTGLVASVARPGGNVTGLTQDVGAEIWGKRLALLKEFVPRLTRVAVLTDPGYPPAPAIFKAMEAPARTLGMTVTRFDATGPVDLEAAFAALTQARSGAVFTPGGAVHFNMRNEIAKLALRNRLPMMSTISEWVEAGGLMSYGASLSDQWRRAAAYVDKILKGARPDDLPVEQPTNFELIVNARTAKALGLAIPPSVRLQAERIVE